MNNTANISTEKASKRFVFHPKRLLKNLQQTLYTSSSAYLVFCFLVPLAISFGIYLTRGLHPFGDGTPLVLDLNAQYAYFFEGLRNIIYGDATSFLYSFSRSLGGEFMGMYAYYLASPLTYIVALFPQDRIQEAVLTILLIKTGLTGFTFGYYLHKHTKIRNRLAIIAFSVMYALSAYGVCQQSNTMWIDALIWLPLLVLGLEQLILNRKYKLYTVSLSFILICNYYIGYMICIFAVMYFFYYYFSKPATEINPNQTKLHFFRTGTRFAIFSVLSAAIAAFMLYAAYYSLCFGKSEFSSTNWSLRANFDILDFLVKLLPGSHDTYEPSGLPIVYCGLLTLILIPIYFTSKKITSREKVASGAILAIFLISFIVNPIDLIWHGFSTPNWLNARYSFLFCFILLVIAYKAFGNLREVSEKYLLGTCAFLVLFVAVAQKHEFESYINSDSKLLTFGCVWFSIFFIITLFVLLCLTVKVKLPKARTAISAVLAAVVCVEIFCNGVVSFITINDDVHFTSYKNHQNFLGGLRPVVEDIKEYDSGFYRMEKTHHKSYNNNFALAIRGISNSTSTLNASAISFINQLGYTGRAHLTQYNGGTPLSDSLLGIKYVIDNENSKKYEGVYDFVEEIESDAYNVYKNPYALSFAYGVSQGIKEYDMEAYSNVFRRYNSLISTMVGEEEAIKVFRGVTNLTTSPGNCKEQKWLSSLKYNAPKTTDGNFTFSYKAPKAGYYYFHSPATDTPESCKVRIGSASNKTSYLERDSNHLLTLGYFNEGEDIKITFYISEDDYIVFDSSEPFLWYFDVAQYEDLMGKMTSNPQFIIDDESTDDNLFGSINTVDNDQMILTTIPYDEGWNVYVDGEATETYKTLGALMAFDIADSGEHTLELVYMPKLYPFAFFISLFAIATFIIICAADFVLKKTLFKNKTTEIRLDIWVLEDFDYADEVYSKEVLACKTDDNPEQAQDTTISFEQIEDDTEQTNGSTEE
jgi:uncharacterized membrane protein YfhO